MPRRRVARKPRRGRKGARRSRIPRSLGMRPQMKHYNYTFKLTPQIIASEQIGGVDSVQIIGPPDLPSVPIPPSALVSNVTLSTLAGSDFQTACSFALSDIASYANFTGLYDAYRITKITVDMEYLSNVSFSGTTVVSNAFLPTFWYYWDQDDYVVPTSLRSVLGKQGVRMWQPTASKTRQRFTFRPVNNVATQSNSGSATPNVGIVANKSNWVNCINPNVPHFAFKLAGTEFPGGNKTAALRLNYTYHVSFRAPLICS